MARSIISEIVKPTMHDFPEDWKPEFLAHGLYSNTCRRCGAIIMGHKYRRTCRVCVDILQREAVRLRDSHGE